MISERSIQQVKDAIDIVDVISSTITIKRTGANFTGCCPFHNEKTPSFSVSPSKGFFKCFGCGESGDAIKYSMLFNNKDFIDTIRDLANTYNITLEETNDNRTPEQIESEKQQYNTAITLLDTAAKRYNRELITKHKEVVEYLLKKRKLTLSTIGYWQIGYAPHNDFLHQDILKAAKQTTAEDIGLIKVTADRMWDSLSKRITIPIHNARGQNIGISGRKLETDTNKDNPKYINPKSSFIYDKSRTLFGLNQAICAKAFKKHGMAILSEGYFDVISMHQAGYDCTVATCGTALTKEQAQLLKKHTDTVLVMRDGDLAGKKSALEAIDILIQANFIVYNVILPPGKDADDMSRAHSFIQHLVENIKDAVLYKVDCFFEHTSNDLIERSIAIDSSATLLSKVQNETIRNVYIDSVSKKYGIKADLTKALKKAEKRLETERKSEEESRQVSLKMEIGDGLPHWIKRDEYYEQGFAQNDNPKNDAVGIWFEHSSGMAIRATRFTVKPLYHIPEQNNNRRLVEVWNGTKRAFIEMPSRAFISMDVFLTCLIERGSFTIEPSFNKSNFIKLVGWLSESMPHCHELKTLGWQAGRNEDFFAFANKILIPGDEGIKEMPYNELGIVEVNGQHYISMGASSVHADQRQEDNIYENDLYLSYKHTDITFEQWADMFCKVYGKNAPFGISYIFLTIFKDIVTQVTKCPILYSYGPKGSGKSEFCESILYLFFSGKNAEGKLIQGYNLNPGQGTPFSFYNLQSRYRNVPIHFNEFDENNIEDWKFGSFKAFYDGQGREVGDGSTGKARKTNVQKTQGTLVVAGQYLSTRDDGSVLSRSITCQFLGSIVDSLTSEQIANFQTLKKWENDGLSSIISKLLNYRNQFKSTYKTTYWEIYGTLKDDIYKTYGVAEQRLIRNYASILAAYKIMGQYFTLNYKYADYYQQCIATIISHNSLLRDNNSLSRFWQGVEQMFDRRMINYDMQARKHQLTEFKVQLVSSIYVKRDGVAQSEQLVPAKKVLFIRFGLVYGLYAKWHREKYNKPAQDEATLIKYMQDQPYYLGLHPSYQFDDKKSSCYMLSYDALGISLINTEGEITPDNLSVFEATTINQGNNSNTDDLPF